jgi:hypothetical protein
MKAFNGKMAKGLVTFSMPNRFFCAPFQGKKLQTQALANFFKRECCLNGDKWEKTSEGRSYSEWSSGEIKALRRTVSCRNILNTERSIFRITNSVRRNENLQQCRQEKRLTANKNKMEN